MERIARWGAIILMLVMLVLFGMQMVNVSSVLAATVDKMSVTCQYISLSGTTEMNTSYVRIQVVLASNLNIIIAQQVVSTHGHIRSGTAYQARLDIRSAHLDEGTLLIIAIGEWDGTKYLRPATLTSRACSLSGDATPMPTMTLEPTNPADAFPTPTPTALYQTHPVSSPTITPTPH
jgi:hypothetical protein